MGHFFEKLFLISIIYRYTTLFTILPYLLYYLIEIITEYISCALKWVANTIISNSCEIITEYISCALKWVANTIISNSCDIGNYHQTSLQNLCDNFRHHISIRLLILQCEKFSDRVLIHTLGATIGGRVTWVRIIKSAKLLFTTERIAVEKELTALR